MIVKSRRTNSDTTLGLAHQVSSEPSDDARESAIGTHRADHESEVLEAVGSGGNVDDEACESEDLVDEHEHEALLHLVREDRADDDPGAGDEVDGDGEELDLGGREGSEGLDDRGERETDGVEGDDDRDVVGRREPHLPVGAGGRDEREVDVLGLASSSRVAVFAPPVISSAQPTREVRATYLIHSFSSGDKILHVSGESTIAKYARTPARMVAAPSRMKM